MRNWLGRKDSNLRIRVPKAGALPLGHAPTPRGKPYRSPTLTRSVHLGWTASRSRGVSDKRQPCAHNRRRVSVRVCSDSHPGRARSLAVRSGRVGPLEQAENRRSRSPTWRQTWPRHRATTGEYGRSPGDARPPRAFEIVAKRRRPRRPARRHRRAAAAPSTAAAPRRTIDRRRRSTRRSPDAGSRHAPAACRRADRCRRRGRGRARCRRPGK